MIDIMLAPDHEANLIEIAKDLLSYWQFFISKAIYLNDFGNPPRIFNDSDISKCFSSIEEGSASFKCPHITFGKFYEDNPGKVLKENREKDFNKFVESIFKKCPKEDLSRLTVESESISFFDGIIKNGICTDEAIMTELSSLIQRLESRVYERYVIAPIDNLALQNSVNFKKIGRVGLIRFEEIEEKIKTNYFSSEHRPILYEREIAPGFRGKLCAVTVIISDEEKLYQKALVEIDNIINLFRIYLKLLGNNDIAKIGIGEKAPSHHSILWLQKDGEKWGDRWEARGYNAIFTLKENHWELLKDRYHLSYIDDILCKDNSFRTQLESEILLAIRWIGMGLHEDVASDKFLKYTIALECLLINGKEQKSKTESLAERCAFLLREDPRGRYVIYKKTQKIYGVRSNIVHDGQVEIPMDCIREFERLVLSSLFTIIGIAKTTELKKTSDLIDWIDRKKMGCYYDR